ncbi:MAG: SDR family oxidoreductase [Chloroflexi bacterium]|nr:SDR family oxidoreductase [Chloroflexota bacterium]MDA1296847.1 SDR family oxidoreductase [Chloroflexota bacterium]
MPRNIKDLFDMTGRTAIVTGGGTHLGAAMATALGQLGASVYLASRRAQLCEEVAAGLRSEGIDATGLGCDATDERQVESLVGTVMADHGRLDVFICNAGGSFTTSYPPDASVREFRDTLEANLTSTYICGQAAGKAMIPARRGSIITLGSIGATLAMDIRIYNERFRRSGPPYLAAKGGVLNLTRAFAAEYGQYGITVNCVSPGQIPKDTTDAGQVETFRLMNALQRTGVPDDLVGAVALLASDAGSWITGQELVVDGGWSIW